MKLYMHPVSTVCRPIRLLIAENGIAWTKRRSIS